MLGNKLVSSGHCGALLEFAVAHLLSLRCGYARLTEPLGRRRAGAAHAWRNVRIAASWQLSMPDGTVSLASRGSSSCASTPHASAPGPHPRHANWHLSAACTRNLRGRADGIWSRAAIVNGSAAQNGAPRQQTPGLPPRKPVNRPADPFTIAVRDHPDNDFSRRSLARGIDGPVATANSGQPGLSRSAPAGMQAPPQPFAVSNGSISVQLGGQRPVKHSSRSAWLGQHPKRLATAHPASEAVDSSPTNADFPVWPPPAPQFGNPNAKTFPLSRFFQRCLK